MNLNKLSAGQLTRQLKLLGAEFEKGVEFSKDELLSALEFHLKNKVVKEIKITKELLNEKGLNGETLADLGFKNNDVVLVLEPAKKSKFVGEYGPNNLLVLSVEQVGDKTRIKLARDNSVTLLDAEQVKQDLRLF